MDAVTDCRVHPPFAPDNDQRPPGEQITRAHFFGEFDPAFERVLIREFYPGAEDGRRSDPTRTMLEYEIFMYEARTAFDCG